MLRLNGFVITRFLYLVKLKLYKSSKERHPPAAREQYPLPRLKQNAWKVAPFSSVDTVVSAIMIRYDVLWQRTY